MADDAAAPDLARELRVDPQALFRPCDPSIFDFETTRDLEELTEIVGQLRATSAIRFGIGMRSEGFNIFALGPQETDKRTIVRHFLEEKAAQEPTPPDLCYVNNFDDPHKPRALTLPPGTGSELSSDVDRFLEELQTALRATFESEEYQARKQSVQEEAEQGQQEAFQELQEEAKERGLALMRTPGGFAFAPVRDGEVIPLEEFEGRPEEERKQVEKDIEELQEKLQKILRRVPGKRREMHDQLRELNQELARRTVRELLVELRADYKDLDEVLEFFDAVEDDVVDKVDRFIEEADEGSLQQALATLGGGEANQKSAEPSLRRYTVNVLVDHGESEHAPVIHEDHPTYQNLLGRVEYLPRMGTLVTDFTLIKPGALHRASGGYLILEAHQLFPQPLAWEGLKRALLSGQVRIESPREAMGLVSTVSLEPEPIPVDTKVVLLGSRLLYYLMTQYEPDFGDLFKVEADFDDRMDRNEDNERLYAQLVAGLVEKEDLRPFDREGVARIIERSARMVGDAERLSARTRGVLDLVREADHWAGDASAEVVSGEHVERAVKEWTHRSSRVRDRVLEEIERGTILIDTEGEEVGQVNGLSVVQLGEFAFGQPSRITARVRLGRGEVTDIEREVEMGGPIHSKGVLILAGFLGARYAAERPLCVAASLVFEQSYSGVDGDSASSAELYALLSAIAEVPLKQSIAVTGSVNQRGEVQPIGGVNEKIEGFFDVCRDRGLSGDQGVLIPRSNLKHLMLRKDVREAASQGRFHVWGVDHVDQGMEILSGIPMGEPDEEGVYPEGTVNRRVKERLDELAERWRVFSGEGDGEST